MKYPLIFLLVVLILATSGCTTTKPEVVPLETMTIVSTPIPEPTLTRPVPGMDPIIGSWDNGMTFNADGSVGSEGTISWRANEMVNYSYFVTTETRAVKDEKEGRRVDPTASATEWIYNPYSDTIHIRDSSAAARRVLLVSATVTPVPSGT